MQTGLLKMIVAIGTVIGSLIVMFMYSIQLTCIFLIFMIASMLITKAVARKNLESAAERQETIGELTGIVEEFYNGRNVIKAYNHEYASIAKVKEAAAKNAIAIIAGCEMINGRMSVGVVQAFFQYINQAAEPLTEASFMINSLQAALASAERVFEMLDEEEEERLDTPSPVILRNTKGQISFQHVSFGYQPGRLLMKNISFSAQPGQKIAIVGSTGAGKTALVNLLMRFYEISGGVISIDGIDKRYDAKRAAQQLRHGAAGHLAV